jgi:hypothetical protein
MEAGGRTFRPSNGRSTMASSLALSRRTRFAATSRRSPSRELRT